MIRVVIKLYIHYQLLHHLCLKELLTMDFSTSRSPIWDGPRKWNMSMLLRVGWALHKRLHQQKRKRAKCFKFGVGTCGLPSHSLPANSMKVWHQPHISTLSTYNQRHLWKEHRYWMELHRWFHADMHIFAFNSESLFSLSSSWTSVALQEYPIEVISWLLNRR